MHLMQQRLGALGCNTTLVAFSPSIDLNFVTKE
jgi:hypothetical protein